jgi:hypothetical protein
MGVISETEILLVSNNSTAGPLNLTRWCTLRGKLTKYCTEPLKGRPVVYKNFLLLLGLKAESRYPDMACPKARKVPFLAVAIQYKCLRKWASLSRK